MVTDLRFVLLEHTSGYLEVPSGNANFVVSEGKCIVLRADGNLNGPQGARNSVLAALNTDQFSQKFVTIYNAKRPDTEAKTVIGVSRFLASYYKNEYR
jgi:hypothetical protein